MRAAPRTHIAFIPRCGRNKAPHELKKERKSLENKQTLDLIHPPSAHVHRTLSREHPSARLTPPPQHTQVYRQHVPYQAPPLHRRDFAVPPVTADDDFFVASDVVGVAEMGADEFRVLGKGDTADERRVVRRDPLADRLTVGGVRGGRGGARGGWGLG